MTAGLILFDERRPQPLPAVANAAFLAALYADYLEAADMPIWQCGPNQFGINILRNFSQSQVTKTFASQVLSHSIKVFCTIDTKQHHLVTTQSLSVQPDSHHIEQLQALATMSYDTYHFLGRNWLAVTTFELPKLWQ